MAHRYTAGRQPSRQLSVCRPNSPIAVEAVRAVLGGPEAVTPLRPGRVVAHGMVGRRLLRVFVDVDRRPPEVVTAYLTGRIGKCRRSP